jgi:hypothetical protein
MAFDIVRNQSIFLSFFEKHNVQMPPEGARHFITHAEEFSLEGLQDLLDQWANLGCPDGVHEFTLQKGEAVTRLWGPKVGGEDLSNEARTMISRGEGRPPQPVVARDNPFQKTDRGTIICFGGVVWTVHSGPSMPKFEDDPNGEWKKNALAYTQEEIQNDSL